MSLDVNFSEPDEFNCNELHSIIKTVAEMKCIDNFTYHVDYLSGKGENYIANVFRVFIKDSSKKDNNISVIVKTLVNTTRQELFHELHKREVVAYRDIIDRFKKIQSNLNIENRIIFPECIISGIEKGNEVIILEDLLLNGFEIDCKADKLEELNFESVSLIITELAKFHGLSFVFEKLDPSKYADVNKTFHDLIFRESFINRSKLRSYFIESYEMSLNSVSNFEARAKLEKVKSKLFDILKMYSQPKEYNVFCHGDCWINNILFRRKEKETNICFVDFQAMRFASPVTDIIYFLYICTDSQFRSQYLENIKEIYYDSLTSFLNLFNIDSNLAYPKDAFETDMKYFLPFGLIIALIELRIVTTTSEDDANTESDVENFNTESFILNQKTPAQQTLFQVRVNDVVKEAVTNGVLDKLANSGS